MVDTPEPAAHGQRRKNVPGKRRTPRPDRADDALDSYRRNIARDADYPDKIKAEEHAREIRAAVRWLCKWDFEPENPEVHYDFRVRPYITEHYRLDHATGPVYVSTEVPASTLAMWRNAGRVVDHFWRVNYHVKKPEDRGFAKQPKDKLYDGLAKSAKTRGRRPPQQPRKRTVMYGADLSLARAPCALITP